MRDHVSHFEALNTRVFVISFGTGRLARAWLAETGAPFTMLLDPSRAAYRAYRLERSLWRSWGGRTFWRYARLMLSGRRWRGIQGDSGQLGGDFIVDMQGVIRLAHPSRTPIDRPAVGQLLAALELLRPGR